MFKITGRSAFPFDERTSQTLNSLPAVPCSFLSPAVHRHRLQSLSIHDPQKHASLKLTHEMQFVLEVQTWAEGDSPRVFDHMTEVLGYIVLEEGFYVECPLGLPHRLSSSLSTLGGRHSLGKAGAGPLKSGPDCFLSFKVLSPQLIQKNNNNNNKSVFSSTLMAINLDCTLNSPCAALETGVGCYPRPTKSQSLPKGTPDQQFIKLPTLFQCTSTLQNNWSNPKNFCLPNHL